MSKTDIAAPRLAHCAHANLRRAMRVVAQHYDRALRPVRLRATQFTLLSVLANRGPLPLTRLAELLVVDRTTLTRNLAPLIARGLVEDGREEDERVRLIDVTDRGRELVAEAVPLWGEAQGRVERGLGGARLEALIGDLDRLVESLRAG